MVWLDLLIICLLLWGGINGYLAGWKRATRSLGVFLINIALAAVFKGDMKGILALHYPVEEAMKVLVNSRLAVPVSSSALSYRMVMVESGLPRTLQQPLLQDLAAWYSLDFSRLVDLLVQVMFNALAFLAMLGLWWGFVFLALALAKDARRYPAKPLDLWGGFLSGMLRQSLLFILAAGLIAPFIWLSGAPLELFDLEASAFVRIGLQVFQYTGIWWN